MYKHLMALGTCIKVSFAIFHNSFHEKLYKDIDLKNNESLHMKIFGCIVIGDLGFL